MPGALGYCWHEGGRGEYLAQYFLTSLGVSAPVIRQEDVGIDFYCALARYENKKLTFHSPYIVQHGASGSKDFVYGGWRGKKWRNDEIEWLFSQELPLFVCTVDQANKRFRLYSTSAMWLLRHQFGREMALIKLCPDAHHDPLRASRSSKRVAREECGGGYAYRVPLGNPIVDLTIINLDQDTKGKAIDALARAIQMEQMNITFRRLGVHVASWCNTATPNDASSLDDFGHSVFWNSTRGQNVPMQIESLRSIAITLALNLDAQQDKRLAHLAPVFGLFEKQTFESWMLEKLPRIVRENIQ